jgi:hypothetical protein
MKDHIDKILIIILIVTGVFTLTIMLIVNYNKHTQANNLARINSFCQAQHDVYSVPFEECVSLYQQRRE